MATIKAYTDIPQSKKLAEILPIESADMFYTLEDFVDEDTGDLFSIEKVSFGHPSNTEIGCWSLAALLNVLPEIKGIPLRIEKVKARDGYDGYYYHIEYKDIVSIPYSKNPVDACYEMIIKLHELNLL